MLRCCKVQLPSYRFYLKSPADWDCFTELCAVLAAAAAEMDNFTCTVKWFVPDMGCSPENHNEVAVNYAGKQQCWICCQLLAAVYGVIPLWEGKQSGKQLRCSSWLFTNVISYCLGRGELMMWHRNPVLPSKSSKCVVPPTLQDFALPLLNLLQFLSAHFSILSRWP